MNATIYHNPKCSTSRAVLQILREAGNEPRIVEYLKTPLSRKELASLAKRLGSAEALLRAKEPLAAELGLKQASEDVVLDAIAEHPVLFNRPVVVTEKGARACRPAETVLGLL
ncbi:arsenate reductase (glutaredoxin) [Acidocella aminolytica]|jgi:arsenate reductase|uniref:Arsenate reductase n=1 Tax=Acidocella aminolytica 101 = DSM 11237 TaxID=1120923 RepID=A0A0D6PG10_9PROT|nr:arsenate reductase (glutaredoxin) [Acidocella aminolytica]GAN80685.1 arsenate reductase [Acidocella aminolytica 101 = DSM 11237]GBQ37495.1 arsenate reductase [Acidocella aminolytica 101 = DSM 11237]SHE54090.1 arsenate reductase [Acidocella aminolytica 101 = DSM 11237]